MQGLTSAKLQGKTFRVKVDAFDTDAELQLNLLALLPRATLALDLAKCCCRDQIACSHQVVHMPQILACAANPSFCMLESTVSQLWESAS
jgi:hypothetical protein